jgi:hypothetical protein
VFDGATLAVSVQYIVHPVEICAQVGRVLKPGAPFYRGIFQQDVPY